MMEIRIENLTKHYGDTCALKDFSVTLTPGVWGLLGPNGAGKSTLMGLLTDTVKRETGAILWEGKDILEQGIRFRREVGYMPQQQGYYDEFSVGRFLFYMAALKGIGKRQAQGEITRLLEVVGLSNCLHKRMGSLSGGMRQRILLVQALLGDPGILLLDEPTAGLDPEARIRIRNYISALASDKIILLATHVVSDVESIAERVLLLRKGELIAEDTPTNLIEGVRPFVFELLCSREALDDIQSRYTVSYVTQQGGKLLVQLVGRECPEGCRSAARVSLDDAYLMHMHREEA